MDNASSFDHYQAFMTKKIIYTPNAPAPVGPYSQAVFINGFLYVSGQIAAKADTGELILTSIEEETDQVMKNLGEILSAADMKFNDVVKCSIFLSDMEDFGKVNGVYARYFDAESAPARETVQVANLPKYVNVEISCIAAKG